MKVNCNKCGQSLVVSEELVGQQVRCPRCEFVVNVTTETTKKTESATEGAKSERLSDSWEARSIPTQVQVPEKDAVSQDAVSQDAVSQDSASQDALLQEQEAETNEVPIWESANHWFLKIPEGLEFGPTTLEQLDDWVRQGRVSTACKVRYDETDWQTATDFYPELVETGNPFQQTKQAAPVSMEPARHLEPHRGTMVLSLAIAGCIVPFLSVWPAVIGTRDLRLMSLGKMDPSGNAMTRSGQAIAMVASIIWFGAFAIGMLALLIATMSGLSR